MRSRFITVTAGIVALGLATVAFVALQSGDHARPVPVRVVAAPPDPEAIKADVLNAVEGALDGSRSVEERATLVENGNALLPTLNGLSIAGREYAGSTTVVTVDSVAGQTATFSMAIEVPRLGHVSIRNGLVREINGSWVVAAESVCALLAGVPQGIPAEALAPCAAIKDNHVVVYPGAVPADTPPGSPNGRDATLVALPSQSAGNENNLVLGSTADVNGAHWAFGNTQPGMLVRTDKHGKTVDIAIPPNASVAIVGNNVWVLSAGSPGEQDLLHIDATTAAVVGHVTVPNALANLGFGGSAMIADSLWLTGAASATRLDPTTGAITCSSSLPAGWQASMRGTLSVGDRLLMVDAAGLVTIVGSGSSCTPTISDQRVTTQNASLQNVQWNLGEGADASVWAVGHAAGGAVLVHLNGETGAQLSATPLPGGLADGYLGQLEDGRLIVSGSVDPPSSAAGQANAVYTIDLDHRSAAYILDGHGTIVDSVLSRGYWLSTTPDVPYLMAGDSTHQFKVDLP